MKTNRPKIADWLDSQQVRYRVITFATPVYTVEQSAAQSGLGLDQIIKSMLLVDNANQYVMVCLPGTKKIDASKVRRVAHLAKRPSFATADQLEKTLGLQAGAVTALYAIGKVPIIFDQSIKSLPECSLSAGEHQYEIIINTADLIRIVKPAFAGVVQS